MISKQTAYDIWIAYDEIAKGEKLLADIAKESEHIECLNLRDAFGRRRGLQLGVPSGENSQRLFDVAPPLAIEVIKAHVAGKKAELGVLMARANEELCGSPLGSASPSGVVCTLAVCHDCGVTAGLCHHPGCRYAHA